MSSLSAKATHIFSAKNISGYSDQSFDNTLTNDITSFEQFGPGIVSEKWRLNGKQLRLGSDATSDLCCNCFLRSGCQNTVGKYGIRVRCLLVKSCTVHGFLCNLVLS